MILIESINPCIRFRRLTARDFSAPGSGLFFPGRENISARHREISGSYILKALEEFDSDSTSHS